MNDKWTQIYDKWLLEGDLKVLLYLRKIQRYLNSGRLKAKQEVLNLTAQIDAMLNIPYSGEYKYFNQSTIKVNIRSFNPTGLIRLPDNDDTDQIAAFLLNHDGIRIKPQNTEHFCTHPLWILWTMCDTEDEIHHCAIWTYREVFFEFMYMKMYKKAAQVYQHALRIKVRKQPLPTLHPDVLKHVMYTNYQPESITSLR